MISFHNSKFHEKIMKKHGRRIRKSYFPNLFFKQNFQSSGQGKIHVSVHIKHAFHNYRFSKNFPLSYHKEKAHGISGFPLKSKDFGLKALKPANEKNIILNFISNKLEPQILYRFTSPELTSPNLKYPEPITPEYISFNFAPLRLIDRKLTGCNLQLSNLRALNPDSSEFGYLNYFSVASTFPNFKILKLKFFENNSRILMSIMRRGSQLLQNCENSFLRGNSLFFTQSRLPVSREISFQKSGFFTGSSTYLLLSLLTTSSFFRKVYDEILRKSEQLRHLDRNIFDKTVLTIRSSSEIKGFRDIKSPISPEILFAPLNVPFNAKSLEQKPYAGKKNIETSHRKQYPSVNQLKKEICEKQQIITTKEIKSLIERKEKQHKLLKAIFCNYKKNKFKKAGFIAKSLANPLIPVLVENDFPRKIQNELLRKIEQFQFTDQDFLFRVDALVKRYCTQNAGFKTSDELQEPLSRHFNLYDLKRKLGFNKEAVKSLSRKKHSDVERLNLRIRRKQDLIERKVEQEHRELLAFRKVQNMSLASSVQFLIQNFREKTAFLLDYEYLTDPENPEMNQNIIHQQRKIVLPYSDKKIKKTLSTGRKFSAQKTIARENIPGKFSKNLLIFQKTLFNEDTPSFPDHCIQQSTSKLITLSRDSLLDGNNGIFRAGVHSHGAVSPSGDHKSKRFIGLESSERNFFVGFNVFQQYIETISEVRTGNFEEMFAPLIVATNKNLKFILKLSSYLNQGSKIWENTVIRTFNCLTTLKNNLIHSISTGFHQNEQRLQPDPLKVTQKGRKASSLSLNKAVLSQLNWKVTSTPSSKKAYQLNRNEKLNLGNTVAFQLNQKEKSRLENKVFSPDFHLAVRQTCMALNYEKLRSIFYIFRYLEPSKLTSEFTRMTKVLTTDYQSFDPHIANYAVGHDLFESHITDYILNSHLSDHYLNSGYASYNKKINSKRKQNQKNNLVQQNRMKSTLNRQAGFAAESLTHSSTPVLAESGSLHKIQNKLFSKMAQIRFPELDFLFRVDAPLKRSGTETIGFKTSHGLLELLSRFINLYSIERKPRFNKEAVKSLPRRKSSGAERPKLRLWGKHNLIERKAEQRNGELSAFGKIRNMSLLHSVQFLIQNFREKTAFLLDYESLTEPGNPIIDQNLIYQQRKVVFPYSHTKIRKILSISRRLSAKKTIIGKYIPGNLVKDLLIFQREFLKKDTSSFPFYNIQQLTSKPITLIKNRLLDFGFRSNFFPKGSLSSTTLEPQRSVGYESSERSFFSGFLYFFRQYHEIISGARFGNFEKMFVPPIVETNKNSQSVLKSSLYKNQRSNRLNSSESTVIHIFDLLTALTHNKSTGFQLDGQRFQSDQFKITQGDRAAFPLGWQETPKLESSFFTQNSYLKTKSASRQLSSGFKVHRGLLARNKLGHTTEISGIYGIDMTGSPANPIQEKKSHSLYAWIQKPFKLPEVLLPSSITAIEIENPAYPQKIPLSQEKENIATYTLEQSLIQLLSLTKARIFKNPVALKLSMIKKYIFNSSTVHKTGISDIYLDLKQDFQAFSYARTRIFSEMNKHPEDRKVSSKGISAINSPRTTNYSKDNYLLFDSNNTAHYSTNNQKMEHKREEKREQQYSGSTTQIDKQQNRFIWPMFLKDLDKIAYRFRKLETLLSCSKQNIASGSTKTPVFGLKEVDINSWQNHIIQSTSVYTETYPFTWTLNSLTTSKQSYPAFSTYFSTSPKKDVLEYLRILYSTSGMKTSAAIGNLSISSKISNPIPRGSLLSNTFLSGILSTSASITLLLRSFGITAGKNPIPVYNLLKYTSSSKYAPSIKYASSIISQYSQFVKKFNVLSNTEIGSSIAESLRYRLVSKHKPASKHISVPLLQLYKKQKPYRQKVSHWKTAIVNLSPVGRKKKAANTGNFLQKTSVNSLKRENNNLQVNKKSIDTFTEAQMKQSLFSDFFLSSKYDFTKGVKWKKISSTTSNLEKTPKNMQDIFNEFFFKSKIPRDFEKKVGFSRPSEAESTDLVFSKVDRAGKVSGIAAFGICRKKRPEFTYSRGSKQKTEREGFVYGTSEPLLEEVKKIKKIIFETRAIVTDHLESHMPQVTGKPEQVMDIEDLSEKIMQSINRRLKIEAERRGTF